jgi:Ras-related protein Rab-30
VGKTAIARQFTDKKWFDEPVKDFGIEYRGCFRFLNEKKDFIRFMVVDVPCAEVTRYYNSAYMHGIIGCILVFDLADRSTLDEAKDWQETLSYSNRHNRHFIQILLGHQKTNYCQR